MNNIGGEGIELWNREDGFYYDVLHLPDGRRFPMKVRSMVGLIPLFAVEIARPPTSWTGCRASSAGCSGSSRTGRTSPQHVETRDDAGREGQRGSSPSSTATVSSRCCRYLLDESEFLSPHGVRARLAVPRDEPVRVDVMGMEHRVDYEPAESRPGLFGGNSNWRGPVWFPVNYLIIESLQKFHFYLGDAYKVECPYRLRPDATSGTWPGSCRGD